MFWKTYRVVEVWALVGHLAGPSVVVVQSPDWSAFVLVPLQSCNTPCGMGGRDPRLLRVLRSSLHSGPRAGVPCWSGGGGRGTVHHTHTSRTRTPSSLDPVTGSGVQTHGRVWRERPLVTILRLSDKQWEEGKWVTTGERRMWDRGMVGRARSLGRRDTDHGHHRSRWRTSGVLNRSELPQH